MVRKLTLGLILVLFAQNAQAAVELTRFVRNKISAGDLASPVAMAEDYKRDNGVDEEYLNTIGWIARGAEMLGQPELAWQMVAELHREIPTETPKYLTPYGAAIEVEGRLIDAKDGRGAAIRYFETQLGKANATSLRSRIRKNLNLLTMEGQIAPIFERTEAIGAPVPSLPSFGGKPVLLFFFAEWCGDCKAQATTLAKVWQKYKPQGLGMIAGTRLYSTPSDEKPMTPDEEKAKVAKVWSESYKGLEDVPIALGTDMMVHYGASATPTFVLLDRKGIVRLYAPTRLSEKELSRRIEEVLAEAP